MSHPVTPSPQHWQPGGATPQPITILLCPWLPWNSQCCHLPTDPGGLDLQKCQGAIPGASAGHSRGPPHGLRWPGGAGERLTGPQHAWPRRSGTRGTENLMVPWGTMPVWGWDTGVVVFYILRTQLHLQLRLFHIFVPHRASVSLFLPALAILPRAMGHWGRPGVSQPRISALLSPGTPTLASPPPPHFP